MKIDYQGIKLNIEISKPIDLQKEFILFFHGFTGCAEDWFDVFEQLPEKYNLIAVDLIGHGKTDAPGNVDYYITESIVRQIKFVKDHLTTNKIFLCGYSMGGRASLSFAIEHPEDIKGLIIESSSAGINNDDEREKRYEADLQLARYIENHTMEEFIESWNDQELFNTQRRFSNDKLKKLNKKKFTNSKIGMANSLRGFSTGIMPQLQDQLKKIPVKVLLITGDLDSKFTGINARIAKRFLKAKHKIVKNSGHNTHLEEPKRFLEIVTNYLGQF